MPSKGWEVGPAVRIVTGELVTLMYGSRQATSAVKRASTVVIATLVSALASGCGIAGFHGNPQSRATSLSGITVGVPPPGIGAKKWSADLRWTEGGFSGVPTYPSDAPTSWE